MRQRRFTLLPAAAFLVAWVPQPALAPPGSGPPGRPLPVAAARPVAMPATTSQPTLGFTVTPTTVRSGEPVVLAGSGCRRGQRVHLQWRPTPGPQASASSPPQPHGVTAASGVSGGCNCARVRSPRPPRAGSGTATRWCSPSSAGRTGCRPPARATPRWRCWPARCSPPGRARCGSATGRGPPDQWRDTSAGLARCVADEAADDLGVTACRYLDGQPS